MSAHLHQESEERAVDDEPMYRLLRRAAAREVELRRKIADADPAMIRAAADLLSARFVGLLEERVAQDKRCIRNVLRHRGGAR